MHQECTKVAKVTVKATIQIHEYFRKMAPSDELLSEYLRQQQLCEEEKEELEEMSWEDKPLHGTYHRPVMANQTEIVVVDKHQKRAVVIDITFPSGSDIQTNERERLEKYQRAERRPGEDVESEGNTWDCEGGRTQFLQLFSSPLTAQSKIHPEQDSGFSILLRVL